MSRCVRLFVALCTIVVIVKGQANERGKKATAQIQAQAAIENGVSVFYAPASKCLAIISDYGTNNTDESQSVIEVIDAWNSGEWLDALVKASKTLVHKYPVYSGVIAFALAFSIVMPVAFIIWCSARYCCGRCSYELHNDMDSRHGTAKRCCCSALLLLIVVTMTACVVLGFLASVTLHERIINSAKEQSAQRGGVTVSTVRTTIPSAGNTLRPGQQSQAAGSSSGGQATLLDSVSYTLNIWQRFITGLIQTLRHANELIDTAMRNAAVEVLRRAAEELIKLVAPLNRAANGTQAMDKQLENLQLSDIQLVRNFALNCSAAIDTLNNAIFSACNASTKATECRDRTAATLGSVNRSLDALLVATSALLPLNNSSNKLVEQSNRYYFFTRLREAVHARLNTSWKSRLDNEFTLVLANLSNSVSSLSHSLIELLSALDKKLTDVRKRLPSESSSSSTVSNAELTRMITTFTLLGLAAFVCALLYVALGFGAWGQRALPLERDELDGETEHCCNRSRAASSAVCAASCLFIVGTAVMLTALAYLTLAFFTHTELCTAQPAARTSSCAAPPATGLLGSVLEHISQAFSPNFVLRVAELDLNSTVSLSPTTFLRVCSTPESAVIDAAAPGLRCELDNAINDWLRRLFDRWPPANTPDTYANLGRDVLNNLTASFDSNFANMLDAIATFRKQPDVDLYAQLRQLVANVSAELVNFGPPYSNQVHAALSILETTLIMFTTPPINITATLMSLGAIDFVKLNATWQRDVLSPLNNITASILPNATALSAALAAPNATRQLAQQVSSKLVMAFGTCENFAAGWKDARETVCFVVLPPLNALWFALGVLALLVIPALSAALKLNQLWRKRYPYDDDRARQNAPVAMKNGYRRVASRNKHF